MNETETNEENKLLINKFESKESNNETIKNDNEIEKNIKDSIVNATDIQTLLEQLNNLPTCLNTILELILNNNPNQFLEIQKKDIKIKIHCYANKKFCHWCKQNCLNLKKLKNSFEYNINILNYKICNCGIENHLISFDEKNEKNIDLNLEEETEINNIIKLHNDKSINIVDKDKLIIEKILNLIKGKENKRILKIISKIIEVKSLRDYFSEFNYDDEIFLKILSYFKENKYYYYEFVKVLDFYYEKFIKEKIKWDSPIFVFNHNDKTTRSDKFVSLLYNKVAFSYSFFFQVYRKKWYESNEIFSFLKKNECSHLFYSYDNTMYSYGFFSIDLIFNQKIELSKNKIFLNIIYILFIQSCDIFSDFMNFGKTERICLIDKNDFFSKLFYENILFLTKKREWSTFDNTNQEKKIL